MVAERSFEYDAFGPWVYVVDEKYALPPIFVEYSDILDGSLMTIKIPRKIDRRKANPKMHLYDIVVGVFESHIVVLRREGEQVEFSKIEISDIEYIRNSRFLLKGTLEIKTSSAGITFGYNTVSDLIINRLIQVIRSKQEEVISNPKFESIDYKSNNIDILYVNLINSMKKDNPETELVAYQPNFEIVQRGSVIKSIIRKILKKELLTCTAFVANATELIIIDRSTHDEDSESHYSYSFTYLRFDRIKRAEIRDEQKLDCTKYVEFEIGSHKFSFVINDKCVGIEKLVRQLNN